MSMKTMMRAGAVVMTIALGVFVVELTVGAQGAAPKYKYDPDWPKPLPNKWSMQQVVGIWVDQMDHVWFLNRGVAAIPIELVAETDTSAPCCVRGPELIEEDQQGNVVSAWGGNIQTWRRPAKNRYCTRRFRERMR